MLEYRQNHVPNEWCPPNPTSEFITRKETIELMSEQERQLLQQQAMELNAVYNELAKHEKSMMILAQEFAATIEAIRDLDNKGEMDAMVPIGGNVLIKTKIRPADKLLLQIKSDVAVEKNAAYIIDFLENRIKNLETNISDLSARRQQVAAQRADIDQKAAQLIKPRKSQDV